MTALVSRISPPLKSKSGGIYQKIEMITQPDRTWCFTYVSPENFNWQRWEKVINAPHGIYVSNLKWKNEFEKMIDADSKVIFNNKKYERRNPIAQLTLEF